MSLVRRARPASRSCEPGTGAARQKDRRRKTCGPDTDASTAEGIDARPVAQSPQKYGIKFTAVYIGEAAAAVLSVFRAFGSRCNQPDRMREDCSKTPR